jgi:hypothetical protein
MPKTRRELDREINEVLSPRSGVARKANTGDPIRSTPRDSPADWVWAYHVTPNEFLPSIAKDGLKPERHPHVRGAPVIFVEPDLEGVLPYHIRSKTSVLRFRTPGFGDTEDGETVLYSGSQRRLSPPDPPFVGRPGKHGVIPPQRLQILRDNVFVWLT